MLDETTVSNEISEVANSVDTAKSWPSRVLHGIPTSCAAGWSVGQLQVADYYKTKGMAQKIARSHFFESATLTIIAVNAVWIGYSSNSNKQDDIKRAWWPFQVMDQ